MLTNRHTFDMMLEDFNKQVTEMGQMVEFGVDKAITALAKQDIGLAQEVISGDDYIDEKMLDIEDLSMKLIATQQPMAKDLRKIGTGFKIITDLERIGDHAVEISKIAIELAEQPLIKPLEDIPRMAQAALEMLRVALEAYVKEDIELAERLTNMDDLVDHIYAEVCEELLDLMEQRTEAIRQIASLLMVSRFLERIADHTTNIGERIIYLKTGTHEDLNG